MRLQCLTVMDQVSDYLWSIVSQVILDHELPLVDVTKFSLLISYLWNQSGCIERSELKDVMGEFGDEPTKEEIDEMILLVDENGDGEIDFEEFLTLMRLRMGESGEDAEQNLRDVFNIFDADGSGFIDRHEMRLICAKLAQDLTEDEIGQLIEVVDQDGDGEISFEEFKTLVTE